MAWTDEMVEELRKMWKEGLTTGEIGKRLNVSKNSIVGKVHRLGLSGRPSPIKKKDGTPIYRNDKKEAAAPKAVTPDKPVAEKEPMRHEAVAKPIQASKPSTPSRHFTGNLSLTELDNHTCRWPVGDPKDENFHFCGKKVRIGQTYCEEHSSIAYVKPSKK